MRRVAMNLREGTRRLALLLGAVGAILGGFASYFELRIDLDKRTSHNRFEQLANSDVVRHEQNDWQLTLSYTPDKAIATFRKLPENQQREVFFGLTQEKQVDLLAKLKCEPLPPGAPSTATTVGNLLSIPNHPGFTLIIPGAEKDDPFACLPDSTGPPASIVNEGGVKDIHWRSDLGIESIDTQDGQTLYPTPAPSAWLYLLVVLIPVFGFFIPWGAVRAIGWVGAGFFQPLK